MGTVATTPPPPPPSPPPPTAATTRSSCGPNLESLTDIDIRKLSQSELQALSMCSDSAFDLHRTDDVVIPNIDRSIFHESSGSRRQGYSRLRDSRHHHLHTRTRRPGLTPGSKLSPALDPENHSILHFLKHYLEHNSTSTCPPPPPPPPIPPPQPVVVHDQPQDQPGFGLQEKMALAVHAAGKKRKRIRKKAKQNKALTESKKGVEMQRVNKKGQEVDFTALESNGDKLFAAELGKRTRGLQTEEKVLGFLRGIEGQWGSTRKRRKFVDANEFGDALPIGWKLSLGLRRRDGRVSVFSHRIVSPSGEQFVSCKEAASFLRSYFEAKGSKLAVDQQTCPVDHPGATASGNGAGIAEGPDSAVDELGSGSSSANLAVPIGLGREIFPVDLNDLPEVQVQDLFECLKCGVSFDKKNAYLQHLVSFHQQTTRRFKFGNSVSQSMIIKDSALKCQFCQQVFLEKCSYDDHVEGHGRNQTGSSEEPPTSAYVQKMMESPALEVPCPTVETNTTIVVASSALLSSAALDVSGPSIADSDENLAGHPHHKETADSDPVDLAELKANGAPDEDLLEHGSEYKVADQKTMEGDGRQSSVANLIEICQRDTDQSGAKEFNEYPKGATEKGFEHMASEITDDAANTKVLTGDEIVLQNESTPAPAPLMHPIEYLTSGSDKGDTGFFVDGQRFGDLTGFEELQLDEMDYDFVGGSEKLETSSLPGVFQGVASDIMLGQGLTPSVGVDTKETEMKMTAATQEFTTLCVWCNSEFKVEGSESDMQLGSIGYMCTACKDNISGHFNRICS
ncbi:OLC1v1002656C1 [Oldenlandia corymbosa var. corymbosa]|uniref:OLC1v1002656C1 n=1 Tax=Oldenlandia corymbosa var. corymbosa TaxID=529605 RepID=A0AAV1DAM2_OLDCO|nr:OLC1v1002656C1 [Oldenlandia corymbosa var. corymbosa]